MEVTQTTSDNFFLKCTLKPRKIAAQNIIHRLRDRELYGVYRPGTECNRNRPFYLNVFPNFTMVNVDIPSCYLRKFSPDGKHFLTFSSDQTSVEIYRYLGPSAAADLLKSCEGEKLDNKDYRHSNDVRCKAFERFFSLKHRVNIAHAREHLNRECSLFTEDSRYVIIGSALRTNEDSRPHFYHIYTNNESVVPNHVSPLEDYALHLVDLYHGKLSDSICFKTDKIFLSHNQGICLYKNTLAVLSVQHQTIHIFHIEDGTFVAIRKIGRFCYEDDEDILRPILSQSIASHSPFREAPINALKHRMLAFLFRRAKYLSETSGSPYELRRFYQYFDQFRALRLWKMQLLDDDHLLLKYSTESAVTLKTSESNTHLSFFMVYNFTEAKVLAFFENTSDELLHFFENFCDNFRNARSHNQFICSPSNNFYARQLLQRFKQTIVSARFGGLTEATKRLLAQLPISAQSYSCSPYLDLSLFSYDDKRVSMMERPKTCGEHPIRFYSRESGLLKFRMHAGLLSQSSQGSSRRLVAFTFHPTDPFAISVHRTSSEYIVNFHVRHDCQL